MADYWLPDHWPPLSPDLNPLDYSIWTKAQGNNIPNVAALKNFIQWQWAALTSAYIPRTCASFCHCLEVIVATNGSYIE